MAATCTTWALCVLLVPAAAAQSPARPPPQRPIPAVEISCERDLVHTGTVELAVGHENGHDVIGPFDDMLRIDAIDVTLRGDALSAAHAVVTTGDTRRAHTLLLHADSARAKFPPSTWLYADPGTTVELWLRRPAPTHVINTADYTLRGCLMPRHAGGTLIERPVLDVPRQRPRVLTPRAPIEQHRPPAQKPRTR